MWRGASKPAGKVLARPEVVVAESQGTRRARSFGIPCRAEKGTGRVSRRITVQVIFAQSKVYVGHLSHIPVAGGQVSVLPLALDTAGPVTERQTGQRYHTQGARLIVRDAKLRR
mgnify:CR=1 FL=1